jgi:hypothetical protein
LNYIDFKYHDLKSAWDGYMNCHIPLIGFKETLQPLHSFDDIGMYILIPKLGSFFSLSLDQSIYAFFYPILIVSLLSAIIGSVFFYSHWKERTIACIFFIVLTLFSWRVGNTYIAYSTSMMMVIPLFLYVITAYSASTISYIYMIITGILLSFFHYIRSFSSVAAALFIIVFICSTTIRLSRKIILITLLIAGTLIPTAYFTYQKRIHSHFVSEHFKDYPQVSPRHTFWHTIYCGFGFLMFENNDNIRFSDKVGYAKAAEYKPGITQADPEYETILKHEVYTIVSNQKGFFIRTIFAKIGVLFMYLLIFANLGLLLSLLTPKPWSYELSLYTSLLFSMIFPIVALPIHAYSLGFIAYATLYGVISINYWIQQKRLVKKHEKENINHCSCI